ncbi:hypothetical protein MKO06_08840 [Gramella sp. GC03-9]|uniref:Uncharacterized protein n=1 Tax=Christiangramia oceanisediminis TaxID=2920386 RepID=A0A9X2KXI2_9FLAO|nr:hypothetical protein [Gramella oceanisediminis]MCP9200011.1 hypothetical protein [Gramella oceanisediminis]
MPKLLIRRNTEWANKMRTFDLYLNGVQFSRIKHNQILSFEVPEGEYQLIAKMGWCGSKPLYINLKEGELKNVEITGFMWSTYLFPVTMVICSLYFIIYLKYGINSLFLGTLMMMLFGYWFFYISFGRHQYLTLKELPDFD